MLALWLAFNAQAVLATDNDDDSKSQQSNGKPEPRTFSKQHSIRTADGTLRYRAQGEDIFILNDDEDPVARFFTLSYTVNSETQPAERPVTFVFNGGPGSASLWLHLGLVGPKTLDIPSDAADPGAPPYALKVNPKTLLRATDIVFVDPVGTGYSGPLGNKTAKDYWGYSEDADSVAEFIRIWITTKGRWNSPKYIMGESYGGLRAGLLLRRLQRDKGIALNGVILVAPALDLATLPFFLDPMSISYVTQLPAYTATAWYHDKLPEMPDDLNQFLEEVKTFARTDYLSALFMGNALPEQRRSTIAEDLHRYTGLSTEYIQKADLRIHVEKFRKRLLHDEDLVLGRLDARYAQPAENATDAFPSTDPFAIKTTPIYTASFQRYLRSDFGIQLDQEYIGLNSDANQNWQRPDGANHPFAGFVNVTPDYEQASKDNSELRIFSAAGHYDLVTTAFAIQSTFQRSDIDQDRITLEAYPGGHMMYLHAPTLRALSDDIVAFIRNNAA